MDAVEDHVSAFNKRDEKKRSYAGYSHLQIVANEFAECFGKSLEFIDAERIVDLNCGERLISAQTPLNRSH
jgi:3-deoxy-D-arabino-heptulosonate 7-phosphate (DAHP) synthase class II